MDTFNLTAYKIENFQLSIPWLRKFIHHWDRKLNITYIQNTFSKGTEDFLFPFQKQ